MHIHLTLSGAIGSSTFRLHQHHFHHALRITASPISSPFHTTIVNTFHVHQCTIGWYSLTSISHTTMNTYGVWCAAFTHYTYFHHLTISHLLPLLFKPSGRTTCTPIWLVITLIHRALPNHQSTPLLPATTEHDCFTMPQVTCLCLHACDTLLS
jgi:hypothetical protein